MWRFLQFVVYASLTLDRLTFHTSKDFNSIIVPDKATKQSRDLKCAYVIHIFEVKTEQDLHIRRLKKPQSFLPTIVGSIQFRIRDDKEVIDVTS